jgi:DNA-binding NtrC family response regulator
MNEYKTQFKQPRGHILIIEDENLVAWDIEQAFRESGFTLFTTISSIAAARALLNTPNVAISLVILDLKLEDGDGSILIDVLQSRSIPVLVITGYAQFKYKTAKVIYKPFAHAELLKQAALLLHGDS